ncbi:uncharacterized protein [Solanum lycopersicum]|uniref:uncharacterized protein n=1 Tax=Solanum lycopersicum TaxID=4081 RepID=UPI003747B9EB
MRRKRRRQKEEKEKEKKAKEEKEKEKEKKEKIGEGDGEEEEGEGEGEAERKSEREKEREESRSYTNIMTPIKRKLDISGTTKIQKKARSKTSRNRNENATPLEDLASEATSSSQEKRSVTYLALHGLSCVGVGVGVGVGVDVGVGVGVGQDQGATSCRRCCGFLYEKCKKHDEDSMIKMNTRRNAVRRVEKAAAGGNQAPPQAQPVGIQMSVNPVGLTDGEVREALLQMA